MYALVEFAGKQFKVEEGSQIKVPFLTEKVGSKVSLNKVLYFDNDNDKVVGTPFIDGMAIDAKIEKHGKDSKVIVFKFKRRKGYQKKSGHRQRYSILTIGKLGAKKKAAPKKEAATKKKAAPKKEAPKAKASTATKAKKTTTTKKKKD
jgi:large subunit ribosomal protein L21